MQKSKSQTKIQNYFLPFMVSFELFRVKILEAKMEAISETSFNPNYALEAN